MHPDRTTQPASVTNPASTPRRVLLFALGSQRYALPATKVAGLGACGRTRAIPGAPPAVLGLVEWRGHLLTALDVPRLLSQEPGSGRPCLVRLARPMHRVALYIPASLQMCEVTAECRATPNATQEIHDGSFEHEGQLVTQIDPQQLIQQVVAQLREAL